MLHFFPSYQVVLSQRKGVTPNDYSGQAWDEFDIIPTNTDYFIIQALSVYTTSSNGFGEIEIYGVHCKGFIHFDPA